jgi:hypothetical protein
MNGRKWPSPALVIAVLWNLDDMNAGVTPYAVCLG